ncbi:MAG: GTPase domain-containing protein [Clostridium sp.]|uniref:GTPase domain-containing protein n=1 Tax=Clostridium sp. TaxID=1506 RepID=UPI003D6D9422
MGKKFFNHLMESEKNCLAFIARQMSAGTITLMGPTSSAKSTTLTEIVQPTINKLLGKNVGDTAQTTLIRTLLMLNWRLEASDVLVQCIPYKDEEVLLLKFLTNTKTVIGEAIYKMRDELEDFKVDGEIIKKILNPVNRSYHAYDFVNTHDLIEPLIGLLDKICKEIIEEPDLIEDAVNKNFKERRKAQKNIKKSDIYEEVIDERFSNNEKHREVLSDWFKKIKVTLYSELENLWTYFNAESFILIDKVTDDSPVNELVDKIYAKNSACSLIFEEIRYAISPSDGFIEAFNKRNVNKYGRNFKLNILDTAGVTQSSQERDEIDEEMDRILQRETDAVLFLCASDEQPSIYETCISLLYEKEKKLAEKPVIICRTKADIVVRNILVNKWRQDTGENGIPSDEKYDEYVNLAFDEFTNQYITSYSYGEDKLGRENNSKVEFLSLASDLSKDMNKVLDNKLHKSRIYEIFLDILNQIDEMYSYDGNRPWLYSIDLDNTPLTLISNAQDLTKTIATALTAYNLKQKNQYLQYVDEKGVFHGRSVNCFWNKLSYGEGHETKALYYLNFKLHIKNMISRWLRDLIPINDMINDFDISYKFLVENDDSEKIKNEFPSKLKELLKERWWVVIDNVAKKLSYDCLQPDFNDCFYNYSWDTGFRKSLMVLNDKFSSVNYWHDNLLKLVAAEVDSILQKMYVFDEV